MGVSASHRPTLRRRTTHDKTIACATGWLRRGCTCRTTKTVVFGPARTGGSPSVAVGPSGTAGAHRVDVPRPLPPSPRGDTPAGALPGCMPRISRATSSAQKRAVQNMLAGVQKMGSVPEPPSSQLVGGDEEANGLYLESLSQADNGRGSFVDEPGVEDTKKCAGFLSSLRKDFVPPRLAHQAARRRWWQWWRRRRRRRRR